MKLALPLTALTVVAGCAYALSGTADPDVVPDPPALAADGRYISNVEVVVLDGPLAQVEAFMEAVPWTNFMEATDRIPAVESFDVLSGTWDEPGAVRRANLAGGHFVHERVLTNAGGVFTYQIWNIQAPNGQFIDHIFGEIRTREVDGGTEVSWSYNVKPAYFFARPFIRGYVKNDFAPFMENAMTQWQAAWDAQ